METKKQILKDISVNTMNELLCTYDFVLPKLYENVFAKKSKEANIDIEKLSIDTPISEALIRLEKTKKDSELGLKKLNTICKEAIHAIKNRDVNLLEKTEYEAKEVIAILKNMEKELYTDEITGLLNRKGIRQQACENDGQNLIFNGAMFVFDLDNFKEINDNYGHAIGDAILKAFGSQVITKCVSNVENEKRFTVRLSGDEFMVIINAQNLTHVKTVLQKMQTKGLRVQLKSKEIIEVKFSFGYCQFTMGESFDEAFILADKNMYKNKKERKATILPEDMRNI